MSLNPPRNDEGLLPFVVVSGTGLSVEELEDPQTSGVGKPLGQFDTFVELGMLDDMEPTLRRYIPSHILESISGKSLQLRVREYLPGRYRFLISFLEFFLMNGLESPHSLLNKYIEQYMLCPSGDLLHTTRFASEEPPLRVEPIIKAFDWKKLRENSADIRDVAAIIQSHLTKSSTPTFGPLSHRHVEYGIARLRIDHKSEIIEPLAFLSVMMWLQTQKDICLAENLRDKLAHPHFPFEQVMILFLLRSFYRPTALSAVFNFHGTIPEWANNETYIVGRLGGKEVPVNILELPPRYPSLDVVYYADMIEDIIRWLSESPAFSVLVATDLFGPDILIKCFRLLLMGRAKSYLTGNINEMGAAHALDSLNSVNWFKRKSPEQRRKLIAAFEDFTILRFLAGFPLDANLDLEADSVKDALPRLGQVPLATIRVDALKAMFHLPGEVNVLLPMEHAFARKRKSESVSERTWVRE